MMGSISRAPAKALRTSFLGSEKRPRMSTDFQETHGNDCAACYCDE
jgi:hypothetical protein